MTNGKIPTWFAVKWLCEHRAHMAEVIGSGGKSDPFLNLRYCQVHDAIEGDSERVENRNDWTLLDEGDNPISDSELNP